MAIASAQVTVTGLAAAVALSTPGAEATTASPLHVTVTNRHATEPLYVGGPGVTDSTGFKLLKDEAYSIDIALGDILFAYAVNTNNAVHVIRRVR